MRLQMRGLRILLAMLVSPLGVANPPVTPIEVFVEAPLSVPAIPNTAITVYDLSLTERIEATAPDFPPDEATARVMATAWLKSPEGMSFSEDLKASYAGHTKMIAYGVLKVPAIVFDRGRFVIYGTLDLARAVEDYDEYRLRHPESARIPLKPQANADEE